MNQYLKRRFIFLHLRKKIKEDRNEKKKKTFKYLFYLKKKKWKEFPCEFCVVKVLEGKDTDCRHMEFLIRNRNSYSKVGDSIFWVLTLKTEKYSDLFCFFVICLCFVVFCFLYFALPQTLFFVDSGSFTLGHTSCQLVRTQLLLERFTALALWWVVFTSALVCYLHKIKVSD